MNYKLRVAECLVFGGGGGFLPKQPQNLGLTSKTDINFGDNFWKGKTT